MTKIFTEDVTFEQDVDMYGGLQVGSFDNGEMATEDALIEAHRSATDSDKPKRGLHLLGALTGNLSDVVSWVVQELVLSGSGNLNALQTALRVKLSNTHTGSHGNQAEVHAADIELVNTGTTTTPLPEAQGLNIRLSNGTGASIDKATLLKLEAVNDGSITDLMALQSTGGGGVQFDVLEQGLVIADASGVLSTLTTATATPGQVPTRNATGDLEWASAGIMLADGASPPLSVTPVKQVIVPEGALTDNGNGSVTLDFAVGSSVIESRYINETIMMQAGDQGIFVDYMALTAANTAFELDGDAVLCVL